MRAIAIFGTEARWARTFWTAILCAALTAPALASVGCSTDEAVPQTSASSSASTGANSGSGAGGAGSGSSSASGSGSSSASGASGNETVKVQILAINDFHGNLEPPSGSGGQITLADGITKVDAGGVAYLATQVATLRAENKNTIVVSAGDIVGASPLVSSLFHDEPAIEAMNLIGLDINGVGNHEFDRGPAELLRLQYGGCSATGCNSGMFFPGASFRFLSANVVVDKTTGKTLFPQYDIRTFDGVKVAFIGMTLEGTPDIVVPTSVDGLTFKDEVETVNGLIPEIQAKGAQAIVVLLHEGGLPTGTFNDCNITSGPIFDIAVNMSKAVDVIVSGHTHRAYNCRLGGKIVTSAASFGRIVTDIDLEISKATGDVVNGTARNVIVKNKELTPDPVVAAMVTDFKDQVAPLANKQIGKITATLDRVIPTGGSGVTALGEVIADAQLAATKGASVGSAEVAFMNPGGVRADLVFTAAMGEDSDGIVTYGEAFTVQPFANSMVVMTLTGDQIKTMLEQQFTDVKATIMQPSAGFSYAYSASAPVGSKIDFASIQLNGKPLVATQTYRVAVNNFLATGGDGLKVLTSGVERIGGMIDIDALVAYFGASSPISPPALDRVILLP
jgi:5'-nucleotidase